MKFLLIALLSWVVQIPSSSTTRNSLVDLKVHFHYYSNEDGMFITAGLKDRWLKISRYKFLVGIGNRDYYAISGAYIEKKNSISFTGLSIAPIANPIVLRLNGTTRWHTKTKIYIEVRDAVPGRTEFRFAPIMDDLQMDFLILPPNFGEHTILRTPTKDKNFNSSRFAFGYSILCPKHMYGVKCDTFCLPNANFECSNMGDKLCRPGWKDSDNDCKTPSGCLAGHCLNGGACVDGAKELTCTCPVGFVGSRCQRCNLNCNRGTCTVKKGKATCKCPINASGPDCRSKAEPCDELQPCGNRGECHTKVTATGHVRYVCVCKPGFTGLDCKDRADACKDNLCSKGSTCVSNDLVRNGYTCVCGSSNTSGLFCEKDLNECEGNPKPCDKDTERCINTYGSYYCEVNKRGHCKNADCGEGGTCKDLDYKYVCECKKGWSGHNCKFSMQKQLQKNLALINQNSLQHDSHHSIDNGSDATKGEPIVAVLAMGLTGVAAWLHWPRD